MSRAARGLRHVVEVRVEVRGERELQARQPTGHGKHRLFMGTAPIVRGL
jgi:hypothetical protein